MPTTTLRFGLIGLEDLSIGTGTFEARLSNGQAVTLNKINLSSFVNPSPVDTAVYYTDGSLIGQSSNLAFDSSTNQLTVGSLLRVGSTGTASETLHVAVDGEAVARIDNTGASAADAVLEFALHGAVDWNIRADDSDSDNLKFSSGTTVSSTPNLSLLRESNGLLIGTDSSDSFTLNGITVDIANPSATNKALTMVSDLFAHGMTDLATTTTYGNIGASSILEGGIGISGFSEDTTGFWARGYVTNEDTDTTDSALAALILEADKKSGTGSVALGATANILMIRNASTSVVLVKGDGDVHNSGGSTAMGVYDEWEDNKLLQAVKGVMDPSYKARLGNWVEAHTEVLERGGVLVKDHAAGSYWISQRGFRGLLVDAINQLTTRVQNLVDAINQLTTRVQNIEARLSAVEERLLPPSV